LDSHEGRTVECLPTPLVGWSAAKNSSLVPLTMVDLITEMKDDCHWTLPTVSVFHAGCEGQEDIFETITLWLHPLIHRLLGSTVRSRQFI
jgi:hypothetical protein